MYSVTTAAIPNRICIDFMKTLRSCLNVGAGVLDGPLIPLIQDKMHSQRGLFRVFRQLKVDMPLLESGIDILIYTMVLIAAFQLTVGMLEKHYQKG